MNQSVFQVLDILRSTELFAPHVAEVKGRNEDPVTTDLVGALLLVSFGSPTLFSFLFFMQFTLIQHLGMPERK